MTRRMEGGRPQLPPSSPHPPTRRVPSRTQDARSITRGCPRHISHSFRRIQAGGEPGFLLAPPPPSSPCVHVEELHQAAAGVGHQAAVGGDAQRAGLGTGGAREGGRVTHVGLQRRQARE